MFSPLDPERSGLRVGDERSVSAKFNKRPALPGGDLTGSASVCFLNHNLDVRTGAGNFCRSLLAAFREVRPDFRYLVLTRESSGQADELALLPGSKWRAILALPKIRAVFRRYDNIHALDGYPYGVIAALAALGLKKKLIITAIGTGALQALDRPIAGRLLRWAYRRADRVVAVSHYTACELTREVPGLKITAVINHGVNADEFARAPALTEMEKLEIKKLRPYIVGVGALKPRKGYGYALEAFAEIRKSHPSLSYVIVGDGPEKGNLESRIKYHGLGGAVVFFRRVRREFLISLYRSAELFMLLPYDAGRDVEGFGLAFLEAAAAGIPVIGATDSGAQDAVAHEKNGFLVPPQDSRAAAEAVLRILSDSSLRQRFSAGSLAFAGEMSWVRAAEAYRQLYESCEKGSGRL